MRQFLSFVFAGIVGGLITLAGFSFFGNSQKQVVIHQVEPQLNKQASFNAFANNYSNAPFDFSEAAAKAMQAVVHISVKEKSKTADTKSSNDFWEQFFGSDFLNGSPYYDMPREGTGSGVIYTHDGYIVTNNHVVELADELEVTLFDNRKFEAEVIGTYPQSDLAVIKIKASGLPILQFADSDKAKIGEWVLAIGNPFELKSTVTAGIISAKGRDINIIEGSGAIESFIQTDAAVNPGNSGGALVDAYGRLLGINTAIATPTGVFSGYSFAIPINFMRKVVDDIIDEGSYQRGYLGINISNLDSDYAKELGVGITQGVVVEKVIEGGASEKAGVKEKDIVIRVNDIKVNSAPELQDLVGRARIGDKIYLTINRKGEVKEIPVKLKGI